MIVQLMLELFYCLEYLDLGRNLNLQDIDVSQNPQLKVLDVNKCGLSSLDVSNNPQLVSLFIGYQFDLLDNAPYNIITNIDLSNNRELQSFIANEVQLDSINFDNNSELQFAALNNNNISDIHFNNNPQLQYLFVENNHISELDLTTNPNLTVLYCNDNNLTELNLKNGHNDLITYFDARNNPNLTCIEVDDPQAAGSGQGNYANWFKDPGAHYATTCSAGITNNIAGKIRVYPNPAHQNIYIDNFDGNYKLINENGQCVQQGHTSKQIAINGLKNGFYILQLKNGNVIFSKKIMIQN